MTNPHAHRMPELTAAARRAAANPEHIWDRKAIDWPLTTESVVIEVGGYIGRWALQIMERYHPHLYVFEPQVWAAETCRAVLEGGATVLTHGLGAEDATLPMGAWETDGCSFVKPGLGIPGTFGVMKEVGKALKELGISQIDLMMINIEGGEYTLIPHMLDKGILPQRLMVQFHTFVDGYGTQLASIHERLEGLGYTVPWTYGVMLTAWERKEGASNSGGMGDGQTSPAQTIPTPRRSGRKKRS